MTRQGFKLSCVKTHWYLWVNNLWYLILAIIVNCVNVFQNHMKSAGLQRVFQRTQHDFLKDVSFPMLYSVSYLSLTPTECENLLNPACVMSCYSFGISYWYYTVLFPKMKKKEKKRIIIIIRSSHCSRICKHNFFCCLFPGGLIKTASDTA